MTKYARPLVLAFALAALAGGAMTAQDKKGTTTGQAKKDEKKEVKGKVEYYEAGDGWRYKVLNAEGKTIMMSAKGLPAKEDALKMLEEVKTIMTNVKPTEGKSTKKDKDK
jgi:hypothetical protein